MLTLPSPEPPVPHACTRQPSGTWMKAPLSVAPLRNMWIVLGPAGLVLPLVEADEDSGSKVVHSHYGYFPGQLSIFDLVDFLLILGHEALFLWVLLCGDAAYAEDGSVERRGSSGVYDRDLEPVDCAVLFCRLPVISRWCMLER